MSARWRLRKARLAGRRRVCGCVDGLADSGVSERVRGGEPLEVFERLKPSWTEFDAIWVRRPRQGGGNPRRRARSAGASRRVEARHTADKWDREWSRGGQQ